MLYLRPTAGFEYDELKKKKKKTFQIVPSLDRRDVDVDEADMKVGLFHGQAAGLSRP